MIYYGTIEQNKIGDVAGENAQNNKWTSSESFSSRYYYNNSITMKIGSFVLLNCTVQYYNLLFIIIVSYYYSLLLDLIQAYLGLLLT